MINLVNEDSFASGTRSLDHICRLVVPSFVTSRAQKVTAIGNRSVGIFHIHSPVPVPASLIRGCSGLNMSTTHSLDFRLGLAEEVWYKNTINSFVPRPPFGLSANTNAFFPVLVSSYGETEGMGLSR
jgi:hypothetical protein